MYNSSGSPTVANCTFSGNSAGYRGGGMYNYNYGGPSGSPTVTNCTFSGNSAGYGGSGGGMDNYNYGGSGSSATVTNCTFSGNSAGYGGGMCNTDYYVGGSCGSPTITNCTFTGNTASSGGGVSNYSSSPTVANCTFSGNSASGNTAGWSGGGGMWNTGVSATVTNCTFSGNTAYDGGGMAGGGTVTNCTFSDNTASVSGGGVSGGKTFTNSIFGDNSAPVGNEIYSRIYGTPTFSHCDIRGSGGSGALWNPALGADGGGNIMDNPRFVAPATPAGPDGLWRTSDDGLRLQSDSPCIGAADPAVAPQTDILGLPRTVPDIGAYEFFSMPPASADPAWLLFE